MEMSFGEFIDKRAILRVKYQRLKSDADKQVISAQLCAMNNYLWKALAYYIHVDIRPQVICLMDELQSNHFIQWDYENEVFSATNVEDGINAAKNSRVLNTIRAKIKRELDLLFGEKFLEIKDYAKRNELDRVI